MDLVSISGNADDDLSEPPKATATKPKPYADDDSSEPPPARPIKPELIQVARVPEIAKLEAVTWERTEPNPHRRIRRARSIDFTSGGFFDEESTTPSEEPSPVSVAPPPRRPRRTQSIGFGSMMEDYNKFSHAAVSKAIDMAPRSPKRNKSNDIIGFAAGLFTKSSEKKQIHVEDDEASLSYVKDGGVLKERYRRNPFT